MVSVRFSDGALLCCSSLEIAPSRRRRGVSTSLGCMPARACAQLPSLHGAMRGGIVWQSVMSRPDRSWRAIANAKMAKMKFVIGPAATTSERVNKRLRVKEAFAARFGHRRGIVDLLARRRSTSRQRRRRISRSRRAAARRLSTARPGCRASRAASCRNRWRRCRSRPCASARLGSGRTRERTPRR